MRLSTRHARWWEYQDPLDREAWQIGGEDLTFTVSVVHKLVVLVCAYDLDYSLATTYEREYAVAHYWVLNFWTFWKTILSGAQILTKFVVGLWSWNFCRCFVIKMKCVIPNLLWHFQKMKKARHSPRHRHNKCWYLLVLPIAPRCCMCIFMNIDTILSRKYQIRPKDDCVSFVLGHNRKLDICIPEPDKNLFQRTSFGVLGIEMRNRKLHLRLHVLPTTTTIHHHQHYH